MKKGKLAMAAQKTRATCPRCGPTNSTHQPAGPVVQKYFICRCHSGEHGVGPAIPGLVAPEPAAGKKRRRRRLSPFGVSILSNVVAGLIVAVVVALTGFLVAHYLHPGHPLVHPARPAVTTTARR